MMSPLSAAARRRLTAASSTIALAVLLPTAVFAQSPRFISDETTAPIYHQGWNDLNKNGAKDPYENASLSIDARVADLVGRMTMDEKTAQMVTLYGYPRVLQDELPTQAWQTAFWKDGIGNIDEHASGYEGKTAPKYSFPWTMHVRLINEVQRFFVEKTRLGIPVDFSNEGIRGLAHTKATSFPSQIAVGSTWNTDLAYQIGRATAREARALGYTNLYSPTLDLSRDPRWGRTPDCYTEEPFLAGELGMAQVRGIQDQKVVSTLKHFAVYSIPKGGRDGQARTDPQTTWREVQTIYLHPFRKAIRDANALGVMASYNDYDGIPVEASKLFLTDILRHDYGFKGYVVSDSKAVEYVHTKHRVAPDYAEAVRQVVEAGLNIRTDFTQPTNYALPLRQLVKDGKLSEEVINARVTDVLRVKFWLGLFDQPYIAKPDDVNAMVRSAEHLAVADRVARESIVLLKNENQALPLKKELKTVAVIGPMADNADAWRNRYGAQKLEITTVLAGIRAELGPKTELRFARGCSVTDARFPESDLYKEPPTDDVKAGIDEAATAAKGADVAILVLGEDDNACSESRSRVSLDLPGYQNELLRAVHATGTPIVLVLSNGRPLSINWAAKNIPAIVEMWFPSEIGGAAVADVLFGDYNPAGRTPVTFPRSAGQIPYNFPAHPGANGKDQGQVEGPLYHFGHGLSYTTFAYANLKITPQQQGPQGRVEVSCDVTNSGSRDGDEVVQLYIRDDYSSVVSFEKMLRGFRRIHLKSGETKTVNFTLTPEDLALYDRNHQWTVEPGRFTVMVGASSESNKLEGHFIIGHGGLKESVPAKTDKSDPL